MKWRFRTNWRGKLILQRSYRAYGGFGDFYIAWMDATTEDLGEYYATHAIKDNK